MRELRIKYHKKMKKIIYKNLKNWDQILKDWIKIYWQSSIQYSDPAVHIKPFMSIFAGVIPVCGVLFLDGRYNKLLHFLVCLSHQVNWRAFLHDSNVLLERLADHLGETQ